MRRAEPERRDALVRRAGCVLYSLEYCVTIQLFARWVVERVLYRSDIDLFRCRGLQPTSLSAARLALEQEEKERLLIDTVTCN